MLETVYDSLLALVYPQSCHLCSNGVEHSADAIVCRRCREKTPFFTGAEILCAKCGAFLKSSGRQAETFCRRCDDQHFDRAKAVGIYDKSLAAGVRHLKNTPFISKNLRRMFVESFYQANFQNVNLIIPVPLSPHRRIERGYNQAEIIARHLADETKITLDTQTLIRQIHTPVHRAAMDRKAREMTVRNAFAVTRPKLVANRRILLIDDVFTSGATASACAKILKENGAEKVYVLTIARAV